MRQYYVGFKVIAEYLTEENFEGIKMVRSSY
jgi:hypothetical protein